jgi:hypothetical protein
MFLRSGVPVTAPVLAKIINTIALRHRKGQLLEELRLPPQKRIVITGGKGEDQTGRLCFCAAEYRSQPKRFHEGSNELLSCLCFGPVLAKIINTIALRHRKGQLLEELRLPPQKRIASRLEGELPKRSNRILRTFAQKADHTSVLL